jgi:hypothetical protein
MTTALANLYETIPLENGTDLLAGKNAKFTQLTPRRVLQTRRHRDGSQSQPGKRIQRTIRVLREAGLERPELLHPDLRCPVLGKKPQTRHLRVESLLSGVCSCGCPSIVVQNCEASNTEMSIAIFYHAATATSNTAAKNRNFEDQDAEEARNLPQK